MVCIYCGGKTRISNSRSNSRSVGTWRRRNCYQCSAVYTTRETPDLVSSLRLQTDSKRLEPFYRDKLLLSLYSSLSHRKAALEEATALSDTVISGILPMSKAGLIKRSVLVDHVSSVLKRFDKAAYVHYKAHHTRG